MKRLVVIAVTVFAIAIAAPQDASAASYYYGNDNQTNSRIEALLREVARLQAELARLRGQTSGGQCYTYGYAQYCYDNDINYGGGIGTGGIRSIDVDYRNSAAYVTVEYRNGREREYIVGGADSDSEVIDAMARTLDISRSQVSALISFDDDNEDDDDDNDEEDIDSIRVTIDRDAGEADARVRYEDGDTDTFSYDTDVKSEIVEELSNDLDIDEDEVEDVVEWRYDDSGNRNDRDIDDVDSIKATVDEDDNRTNVRVEWEDDSVSFYTYQTDDEDDVIEELSDDLDIDEDDIEDIIDFRYN